MNFARIPPRPVAPWPNQTHRATVRATGLRGFGFVLAGVALALAGCSEPPPPPQAKVVRAVKTMVVTERAGTQVRRIAGVVEADLVTDLSFETAGRLVELKVDVGDSVAKGDLIAALDPEPFQLAIRSANGSLNDARARRAEAETRFKQQEELIKKGYTARTDFEAARATVKSARSSVDIARSQLSVAERNLTLSRLLSPAAGSVSERYADQFAEISAGQKVIQLSGSGQRKIETNVPEGMIGNLSVGDKATVRFPTLPDLALPGRIGRIGTRAGAINSFPVTVEFLEQSPEVKPGLTAEVLFEFETAATGRAFLLPLTAVLPQATPREGIVYVFDPAANVVRKRKIDVINVRDNQLEVTGDIAAGDIVAVAGVSFLVDGMEVKQLAPRETVPTGARANTGG